VRRLVGRNRVRKGLRVARSWEAIANPNTFRRFSGNSRMIAIVPLSNPPNPDDAIHEYWSSISSSVSSSHTPCRLFRP
jgi:hypothetical protein